MSGAHQRYIRIETGISILINVALTAFFVWLNFYGRASIPLEGPSGVLRDGIPQNIITVFMSLLVPTLLTRRRCRAGDVAPLNGSLGYLPSNAILRALAVAIAVSVIAVPLTWIVLPVVSPPVWAFWPLLTFKVIYSACLAAAVTPFGLIAALKDRAPDS
jgi:hypothetical protein